MKEFLKNNKKYVLAGVILLVLTVLLCIPTTLKIFVSVFGYVAYFYLVVGYAVLFISLKKIKLPISKKRLVLYIVTVLVFIMTLHIGISGKELVESDFGGYIGGSYDKGTVGGALFSFISLPIVLWAKYIVSLIIYFVTTAICGFLIIMPFLFKTNKKQKKTPQKSKEEEYRKTSEKPTFASKKVADPPVKTAPVVSPKPTYVETPAPAPTPAPTPTPIAEEPAVPVCELSSKEYAQMLLFGTTAPKRTAPPQQSIPTPPPQQANYVAPKQSNAPFLSQKDSYINQNQNQNDKNVYKIIEGVDAIFVPPNTKTYTNNYLNQHDENRKKLFDYPITDDYAQRSMRLSQQSIAADIKSSSGSNRYLPSETLYEKIPAPAENPYKPSSENPYNPSQTESLPVQVDTESAKPEQTTIVQSVSVQPATTQPTPIQTAPVQSASVQPDIISSTKKSEEYGVDEDGEIYDVLPTVKDSPFVAALRADQNNGAPANVYADKAPVSTVEKPTQKPEPAPAPDPEPEPEQKEEEEKRDPNDIRQYRLTKPYAAPPVSLLQDHTNAKYSPYVDNYAELKEVFEEKLKNFGIDVKLINVVKGPTVTLCVLDLAPTCSIKKVTAADKDIERLLKTPQGQSINILLKLPNSDYFGIEIPNSVKGVVSFKEVMASPEWNNAKGDLVLGLGKTNAGEIVIEDLAEMPHALVAGSSGSGKSVCINAIIASLLYRYSPDELKLVLIDLKFVEMANFAELPHMLFKNPLNDVAEVINALNWLREETNRRFMAFRDLRCRNLGEYNKKVPPEKQLPRIVMIIDEASELMTHPTGRKVMEATLSSIARVARAAGVHMLFATQTPSKDVITSEIQNNMTTKIAFAVSDYVQSQVIFKSPEAAKLLGKGDMMIKKSSSLVRAQCALVKTEEIDAIVDYIKKNNAVEFDEEAIERILHGSKEEVPMTAPVENKEVKSGGGNLLEKKNFDNDSAFQDLVKESLKIFVNTGKVSATYIQRRFSKGYNTIANVMDYLEEKGYVSEPINNKRSLLITKEQFYQIYPDCMTEEEEE